MDTLEQRLGSVIRYLRKAKDLNLADVGNTDEVDLDVGNLSRMERGKQRLDASRLNAIAEALGIRLSHLCALAEALPDHAVGNEIATSQALNQAAEIFLGRSGKHINLLDYMRGHSGLGTDFSLIDQLNLTFEGGEGPEDEDELQVVGSLAFRTEFLEAHRLTPKTAKAFKAKGRSQEPYIFNRDVVVVRMGDIAITGDEDPRVDMFAMMHAKQRRLKRVLRQFDGSLLLRSFNTDREFADERIAGDQIQALRMIGRVAWRGGGPDLPSILQ